MVSTWRKPWSQLHLGTVLNGLAALASSWRTPPRLLPVRSSHHIPILKEHRHYHGQKIVRCQPIDCDHHGSRTLLRHQLAIMLEN